MSASVRRKEFTDEFGRSSDLDRNSGGISAAPQTTARMARTRSFMTRKSSRFRVDGTHTGAHRGGCSAVASWAAARAGSDAGTGWAELAATCLAAAELAATC